VSPEETLSGRKLVMSERRELRRQVIHCAGSDLGSRERPTLQDLVAIIGG
jgi:hypothetical protein